MFPKTPFVLNTSEVDQYLSAATNKAGIRPLAFPPTSPGNKALYDFLLNTQGNILQPHGRTYGSLLLFAFEKPVLENPPAIAEFYSRASKKVTRALEQYSDARNQARDGGMKPFISLALTAHGVCAARRELPPEGQAVTSFRDGMYAQLALLGDPADANGRPTRWEHFYARDPTIHGAWLIAHKTPDGLARIHQEIEAFCDGIASIVHVEDAITMRDSDGFAREHFGFRDGISMPKYFAAKGDTGGLVNPPLDQVLLDSEGTYACCSFMVYRKLEQHVDKFHAFEKRLGAELSAVGIEPKDPGRFVIGRDRDGRPLAAGVGIPESPNDVRQLQFTFKKDPKGSRCPFSAHIRKAFFRQGPTVKGPTEAMQVAAQLVRRGMLFGAQPDWPPKGPPAKQAGLHFMAYMANIASQFELMQMLWFRGSDFPVPEAGQPDPVLFGSDFPGNSWSWPQRGIENIPIDRFVTPLGGAYLFVPSINWLQNTSFP